MNQPSAITNRLCKKSNKNGNSIRDRLGVKRSGVEKLVKNSHFSLSDSTSSGAHIKVKIPQTSKLTSALSILIRKRRTILASLLKTKPTNDYINSLVKIGMHSDEFLNLYSQSSTIHSRTSAAESASTLVGSSFSQQQIYRQEYQQIDKTGYQQHGHHVHQPQHLRYQRPISNVSDPYRPQLQVQMNRNSIGSLENYNVDGSITLIVGDPQHPAVKEDEFLSVFEDYGEILKFIVKKNSFFAITGATIVFRNRQDGLKVIRELNGKLVYGMTFRIHEDLASDPISSIKAIKGGGYTSTVGGMYMDRLLS